MSKAYVPPSRAHVERGNARAAVLRELQRTNPGAANSELMTIVDELLPFNGRPWIHGDDRCPLGHKKVRQVRGWRCPKCQLAANRASRTRRIEKLERTPA